jgi:hypothetical protein
MPKQSLFTDDHATDLAYINTRAASNEWSKGHRENCERLWEQYEPFADPEFRTELRSNFDARYWEMYLTTTLISLGYNVRCPKPGPDVGIEVDGLRIWFEATSPDRGADGAPDQVPPIQYNVAQDVPTERMILRYLNSISTKKRQHEGWLKNGSVDARDAFVIAINPRGLGHEIGDGHPPRILQTAFAVGNQYVVIDSSTMKQVDSGYEFRDAIKKTSGAAVATGVFQQETYASLSGLLCSRIDVANQPQSRGRDFQLVPNANAKVTLPDNFRLPGTYFRVERKGEGYDVTPEIAPAEA